MSARYMREGFRKASKVWSRYTREGFADRGVGTDNAAGDTMVGPGGTAWVPCGGDDAQSWLAYLCAQRHSFGERRREYLHEALRVAMGNPDDAEPMYAGAAEDAARHVSCWRAESPLPGDTEAGDA
jgi:hypothetical protein